MSEKEKILIEPKDLPLIFERFYKVDKSRMGTEGTGLGLSIAKLLTQLMGGQEQHRADLRLSLR